MKRNLYKLFGSAVLALVTLTAPGVTANAQTGTRLGGPLALFYRGQTVSTLLPVGGYISPAFAGTTVAYRTLSSGQVSSTYSIGTGRQTNAVGTGQQSSQQTSNGLSARRDSNGALIVQWIGDTSNVRRIYIGIVDSDYNVIEQRVITSLPVRAAFNTTTDASLYGVRIEYVNGASNAIYAPIP